MAYPVLRFDDNKELCFDGEGYQLRAIVPGKTKGIIVFKTNTYCRDNGNFYSSLTGQIIFALTDLCNIKSDDIEAIDDIIMTIDTDNGRLVLNTTTFEFVTLTETTKINCPTFSRTKKCAVTEHMGATDPIELPTLVVQFHERHFYTPRVYQDFVVFDAAVVKSVDVEPGSRFTAYNIPCSAAFVFQIIAISSGKHTKAAKAAIRSADE
jgi:hypothetical protein